MTTTLQYLDDRLSLYTPLASTFTAMRKHREGLYSRLDAWCGIYSMFETGSLLHGTGVWQHVDADYFVSLKGSRPTATTALNKVRDALKDKYPNTKIRVSRPAVVCEFASGTETVEVVPAYPATDLTGGYWIPNPVSGGGDWMRAFPSEHNSYVNEVNKDHNGGAKKLARLAKVWKYKRSVPISSCYLEMRAAKYASEQAYWSLPMDIAGYFRFLRNAELRDMNDPTGKTSRFSACSSDATRRDSMSRLDTAVTRAEMASAHYLKDNHDQAISYLRLLFNE